jgi:hypothetical protein
VPEETFSGTLRESFRTPQCTRPAMTKTEAEKVIGFAVQSDSSEIFGTLEYVTADGWGGVRGPSGRLDEIQVGRIYPDPT